LRLPGIAESNNDIVGGIDMAGVEFIVSIGSSEGCRPKKRGPRGGDDSYAGVILVSIGMYYSNIH